jgi:hypothetical protein
MEKLSSSPFSLVCCTRKKARVYYLTAICCVVQRQRERNKALKIFNFENLPDLIFECIINFAYDTVYLTLFHFSYNNTILDIFEEALKFKIHI